MKLLALFMGLFLIAPCHAETLHDLVEKSIDDKKTEALAKRAGQEQAKAMKTAGPPAGATSQTDSAARPSNDSLRAEDIQVYAIYGVGDDLRAKVRFRGENLLVLSKGQSISGWSIASLTPDSVTFELLRPNGDGGKGVKASKAIARKTVYLSGAGAGTFGGHTAAVAAPGREPELRIPR